MVVHIYAIFLWLISMLFINLGTENVIIHIFVLPYMV